MGKFDMMQLLNKQSTGANETANVGTIAKIPLGRIRRNEKNFYGMRDLELLASNIAERGLMQPLIVCPAGDDGYYQLIDGERRYRALAMNGEKLAECRIIEAANDDEAYLALIMMNATQREQTPGERSKAIVDAKRMIERMRENGADIHGRTRELLAEMFGVSPAQVGRAEKIEANLSDELKEEYRAGSLQSTQAYDLAGRSTDQQQAAAVELRETGKLSKRRNTSEKGQETVEDRLAEIMPVICDEYCKWTSHELNLAQIEVDAKCDHCRIEASIKRLLEEASAK